MTLRKLPCLWIACLLGSVIAHAGLAAALEAWSGWGWLDRWRPASGPAVGQGDGSGTISVELLPDEAPGAAGDRLELRRVAASPPAPAVTRALAEPLLAEPREVSAVPEAALAVPLREPPALPEAQPDTLPAAPPRPLDDPAPAAAAQGGSLRGAQDPLVRGGRRAAGAGKPPYPERCIRLRHEGVAEIECHLDASGRVTTSRLRRSAGCPELDEAALTWVRRTVFQPATLDGRPVPGRVVQPARFRLEDR